MAGNKFEKWKSILKELQNQYETLPLKVFEKEFSERDGVIGHKTIRDNIKILIEHEFIKVTNEGTVLILKT